MASYPSGYHDVERSSLWKLASGAQFRRVLNDAEAKCGSHDR